MSTVDEFMGAWSATPARTGPEPTDEQQAILDAFATGDSLKVEAGAGTGKSSTLRMCAQATRRPGRYIAFNKAIVTDARMPANVTASTAHSLAYRAIVGPELRARLGAPRMKSAEVARHLDLEAVSLHCGDGRRKWLDGWRLAGIVQRAVEMFCQSADEVPGPGHVPRQEGLDDEGHLELAEHLAPFVRRAWDDLASPVGFLPYRHSHYLKAFQLTHPRLECDFILYDEAQDANPVMTAIVEEQDHAQLVVVGDSNQSIYGWNGAIDAIRRWPIERRLLLTRSWRFGSAIAEAANQVLSEIGTDLRLVGSPDIVSTVEHLDEENVTAVLCRTNAGAVEEVLDALDRGRKPALVGGGEEVLRFAYGASDLQAGKKSTHPDLACFDSWAEVLDYVESDAQGHELSLLVKLVQRFTVRTLIAVLQRELVDERSADVVISTAHKAKGREWSTVRLSGDLAIERDEETGELDADELRLLYVAVTRAREVLDAGAVPLRWPAPDRGGEW